jgi:glycosyltransferase involved in cell wall biosynthesis
MRVMLVHNRYRSNGPSGENRVVDTEAGALAAAGHEVVRFGRNSDEIEDWPLTSKALLPARVVWNQRTRRDLSLALREHKPDIVHVHNTFPLLSDTVLYACRDERVPVVATLHNYRLGCTSGDFFRAGDVCHDCVRGRLIPGVTHGCYRGSRAASVPLALSTGVHRAAWRSLVSAYVFISASQRDLLSGIGLPPERLFVRHNMVPYRARRSARREPFVLFAGRLADVKGLPLLMAAWDRYLRASEPGLRLVIAGSGPMEQELAAWARSRPSVAITGLLPADRCSELMSKARAVVVPSAWEEPFGLVVVEAMAAGTAPIATAHGSFPELITPGVDGALFGTGDAAALAAVIADVEADPVKYDGYGNRARESYEHKFDAEHSLRHLLEIYTFAAANPAAPLPLRRTTRDAIEPAAATRHLSRRPGRGTAAAHHGRGTLRFTPDRRLGQMAGAQPRDHQLHLRPEATQPRPALLVRVRRQRRVDRSGQGVGGRTAGRRRV